MKRGIGLAVIFILLALALWGLGERSIQLGKEILPASWTAQAPAVKTVSLRNYGLDTFLRQILFGPPHRRYLVFGLAGFFALAGLLAVRSLTQGSEHRAEPRWNWTDIFWVILSIVVFREALPVETPSVPLGLMFLYDASIVVWIWSIGIGRGWGLSEFGLHPSGILKHIGLGVLCALLILPVLAVVLLCALAALGVSAIPAELRVQVPSSPAAGFLAILVLPFFEEVLFRGFFYPLLRVRFPKWLSALLVSFLFAAIHGSGAEVGVAQFLGSILMCRLYERTGTLWSSLAAHATFNALLLLGPSVL